MTIKGLIQNLKAHLVNSEILPTLFATLIVVLSCIYQTIFMSDSQSTVFTLASISGLVLINASHRYGFFLALVLQAFSWAWMSWHAIDSTVLLLMLELTVIFAYYIITLQELTKHTFQPRTNEVAYCAVTQDGETTHLKNNLLDEILDLHRKVETLEQEKVDLIQRSDELNGLMQKSETQKCELPQKEFSEPTSSPRQDTSSDVELLKHDLEAVQSQKERLWQQLFDARQEITVLYQQKQEMQFQLSDLSARDEHFKIILKENDELKNSLLQLEQNFDKDRKVFQDQIQWLNKEKHELNDLIAQEKEDCEKLKLKIEQAQRENAHSFQELKESQAKPDPNNQARLSHEGSQNGAQNHFEPMYRQLKEQFEEKSKTLDDARKEIFVIQENLETKCRELDDAIQQKELENFSDIRSHIHIASIEQSKLSSFYEEEVCQLENLVHDLCKEIVKLQCK